VYVEVVDVEVFENRCWSHYGPVIKSTLFPRNLL